METEIILTPLQEIGWKIFDELYPDMRYEISKHLMDVKQFYIIEKVFGMLHDYHRYKFLMNYNLKKLENERDWNHMIHVSLLYNQYERYGALPNPDVRWIEKLVLNPEACDNVWRHEIEEDEKEYSELRKKGLTRKLYDHAEKEFLEKFRITSSHFIMLKKYKQDGINKFLNLNNNFTKYNHYDWCDYSCPYDHSKELQYREIYENERRAISIKRAIRVAINRFIPQYKKFYPNAVPNIDEDTWKFIYNLLDKHINLRDNIYDLEFELTPDSESEWTLTFLV